MSGSSAAVHSYAEIASDLAVAASRSAGTTNNRHLGVAGAVAPTLEEVELVLSVLASLAALFLLGAWGYSIYDVLNQPTNAVGAVSSINKDAWVLLMIVGMPVAQLYWFNVVKRRLRQSRPVGDSA